MFAFCVISNLASMSLDFTQAFPQDDTKNYVIMEKTFGNNNLNGDCILKLKKNFYRLRDGNLLCYECLKRDL